ncbi:MAG: hypothetical protein H6704_16515 [Myxococcales bacterium]|nr:hypothetical protein [Myxococcales bacterium]
MPAVRTVWLLGSDRSLDVLYEALRGEGAEVDRLGPPQVQSWLEQVQAGQTPSTLPSLLVASAALAWQDDGLLLRTLAEHQPWRFLPLVVVANADDSARCDRSYDLGAAGWVVIPTDEGQAREAGQTFARYWLRTTLLPEIGPAARL